MSQGRLIGQGRTAAVYAWGEHEVLKLFVDGFPRVAIEHEHRIGREPWSAGLPVARTDDLIEVAGRLGILFERVDGRTMRAEVASRP